MPKTKTQDLVSVLQRTHKKYENNYSTVVNDEAVSRELENRERFDRQMMAERQDFLDSFMPERVNGTCYEKQELEFNEFDF